MTLGERIERLLFLALFALAFAFAAVVLCCGCVDAATRTAEQAANNKVQILLNDAKNSAKLATEKAKEASDAAVAAAEANPARHPFLFASQLVREIHAPLLAVAWISSVAFFAAIGLWLASRFFTGLGAIFAVLGSVLSPVLGCIAAGTWSLLLLLPWAVWITIICLAVGTGSFLYQLFKAHWNIFDLFQAHAVNAQTIQTVANAAGVPLSPGTPPSSPSITFTGPGSQGQPLRPY